MNEINTIQLVNTFSKQEGLSTGCFPKCGEHVRGTRIGDGAYGWGMRLGLDLGGSSM